MTLLDNLTTMLARGQDNALIHFGLGSEYLKLKQFDKAIVHLRRALEHDVQYSAAWKLLGQALVAAERHDEATAAYERGIEVALKKGDQQTAKEMAVFLRRLPRD